MRSGFLSFRYMLPHDCNALRLADVARQRRHELRDRPLTIYRARWHQHRPWVSRCPCGARVRVNPAPMLRHDVWKRIDGGRPLDFLCDRCVRRRLGRPYVFKDLTFAIWNHWWGNQPVRLLSGRLVFPLGWRGPMLYPVETSNRDHGARPE